MERRVDDDIVRGGGDIGKFHLHLGTNVFHFQRVNRFPRVAVGLQRQLQHAVDDALFGVGEFTTFYFGRETPVAAEQVIHRNEHQAWRKHDQTGAAQRLEMNQVKVGWHRQVAGKLVIRLNADRTDRDIRATTQQVEQPHTELTCKTFVNDLQRLQTFTNYAALGIRIIGTNIVVTR